ncbi:MAG: glucose 1-dehydrogenase [Dehalococcoidia bacterium]|nr:glucose 1-dehydrogenase [Dehalococcoidia bacterium]
MEMTTERRVAIVTGGSRGIGRGISLALAKAGADVAICFRRDEDAAKSTVAEIEAMGRKAAAFPADVTDYDKVKEAVAKAVDTFGRIDILVNNAGIASRGQYIADTDIEEMHRVMNIHLFGAFHFVQSVLPHMRKQERGDIHFISSMAAAQCAAGHGPYATAKAALEAFAKVLAKEELPNNIRVNAIALGLVETEMGTRLVKATTGQSIKDIAGGMPFQRVCQPADVGNLCAFLCSDEAGYISGHVISLDGGSFRI